MSRVLAALPVIHCVVLELGPQHWALQARVESEVFFLPTPGRNPLPARTHAARTGQHPHNFRHCCRGFWRRPLCWRAHDHPRSACFPDLAASCSDGPWQHGATLRTARAPPQWIPPPVACLAPPPGAHGRQPRSGCRLPRLCVCVLLRLRRQRDRAERRAGQGLERALHRRV